MTKAEVKGGGTGMELAVIGMAARFPGAKTVDEFWENLKNGVESITFFSDKELEEKGVNPVLLENTNYIKAKAVLDDIEYFDALFFEYTPREAEVMDPQLRIFHECAWEALENAGYDPGTYDGLIGLYTGAASSFYWEGLSFLSGKYDELGYVSVLNVSNKDFLSTTISYRLNLRGPAVIVQSACSTSLVAIHWACRSLLLGECDMALAGGISIHLPKTTGYMYQEGMISSPDGHCRSFDKNAKGTIGGSGVGIVVLKRLKRAAADRDHIYALVKGSAINNDGKRKIGYTAPSVEGQDQVIRMALAAARVEPESIGYLETHGTATELGDPVEIEALTLAFNTNKKGICPIGSVKSNLGHLDTAAGVAGFIKTVLALTHKLIPPNLNFEAPNPKIDFENSPFYVNTTLSQWQKREYPRRAGVSSFGVGGTNAHVILEEAPAVSKPVNQWVSESVKKETAGREYQLILLSAKTKTALQKAVENLSEHFKKHPGINLANAAYTLHVGRRAFPYRRTLVCSGVEEAVPKLSPADSPGIHTPVVEEEEPPVVFMFSGLGGQYVDMGRGLYEEEPLFRKTMDCCFEILRPLVGEDMKEILYPGAWVSQVSRPSQESSPALDMSPGDNRVGVNRSYTINRSHTSYTSDITHMSYMNRTDIAQLVIFIIEYALAALLMKWGIKPRAMIGYSFGEYAAACIAGVISLEDAIHLVVLRSQLIKRLPTGAMLSVPLPTGELKSLLNNDLAIAIDNGPSCVIAGPNDAVDAFENRMKKKKCLCMRLHASHAVHSKMMAPILRKFEEIVARFDLKKPQIPYISNVTGNWITAEEATAPSYWARHLRETVRFAEGIKKMLPLQQALFVEIGPGRDLTALLSRYIQRNSSQKLINLIKNPQTNTPDVYFLLNKIGYLWRWGVKIDAKAFYPGEKRYRIPLPTYPFEGQRYWLDGNPYEIGSAKFSPKSTPRESEEKDISGWFYIPSWKKTVPPLQFSSTDLMKQPRDWLIFADYYGIGTGIGKMLKRDGHGVITVKPGEAFSRVDEFQYTIHPPRFEDYQALVEDLTSRNKKPGIIVHLWSVSADRDNRDNLAGIEFFKKVQDLGFYSLLFLTQALVKVNLALASNHRETVIGLIRVVVITDSIQAVTEKEKMCPEKAPILGLCKTIPLEYQNIMCQSIDLAIPGTGSWGDTRLIRQLAAELLSGTTDLTVAYRDNTRWVQYFQDIRLNLGSGCPLKLKENGVYWITGGLGRDSLVRAKYLAQKVKARLILTGRSGLPNHDSRDKWLESHEEDDPVSIKIKAVQELEKLGAEVLVIPADVSNEKDMKAAAQQINKTFGAINGVIHSAGITTIDSSVLIPGITRSDCELHFRPKVYGAYTLEKVLEGRDIDFCILTSSVASFYGGGGLSAYTAASIFMDTFARKKHQEKSNPGTWMSLNWEGGTPEETVNTFRRVLNLEAIPQLVVSRIQLEQRINDRFKAKLKHVEPGESVEQPTALPSKYPRPELLSSYTAPGNGIEKTLVHILENFFGIEPLGIRDDFFQLGGDSLKAITVISKIYEKLNVELTLAEFFKRPTVEALASYIERETRKSPFVNIDTAEQQEYYALSSAQKRFYVVQQMDPGNIGFNITTIVVLEGESDRKRIERAFTKLVQRHESLRTSFPVVNSEAVQKIHHETDVDLKIENYEYEARSRESANKPGLAPNPCLTRIIENFIRPFDLSAAPLLRVGLINLAENKRILMVDIHHIIADGLAVTMIDNEFITLYGGGELPPVKLHYKDYSEWQNRDKQKQMMKKQEEYWLKIFAGEIPRLNLPTDYERPDVQTFVGDSIDAELDPEQTRALKELTGEGITLYMVVLAIANIWLSKVCLQEKIVMGTGTAGRTHPDLQQIIGAFQNMIVLVNYPGKEKTFWEFLNEVKERTMEAFQNQDYQFEELVRKTIGKRDVKRNPLFDVFFLLNKMEFLLPDIREQKTSGLILKPYGHKTKITRFDLGIFINDMNQTLAISFEYAVKLFKRETVERFMGYFMDIAAAVVEDKHVKLKDIKISHRLASGKDDFKQSDYIDFEF